MPEKSDPIAHNGKQSVLVYGTWQNLLKFLQGDTGYKTVPEFFISISIKMNFN